MRTEKGQPGYVKARKQKYLLGAVVEFAIVIAIFVTGYIQTGSRLNLLTVVAVVGCLPAAKMLVEFITMAPYKSIEEAKYQELEEKAPLILKAYDMIITSSQRLCLWMQWLYPGTLSADMQAIRRPMRRYLPVISKIF